MIAGPWHVLTPPPNTRFVELYSRSFHGQRSFLDYDTIVFRVNADIIWHWRYRFNGLLGDQGTASTLEGAKDEVDWHLRKSGWKLIGDERLINFL